jgi:hypothetical protein
VGLSGRPTDICMVVRLSGGSILFNARTGAEKRTDDLDVSSVTRHKLEQNRVSRWLRDEYGKHDISPFTIEVQEIVQYRDIYE